MGLSRKFAITLGASLFLLVGCSGGDDLWPSLDASDPVVAPPQEVDATEAAQVITPAPKLATPVTLNQPTSYSAAPTAAPVVANAPITSSAPQSNTFVGNKVNEMARDLVKLQSDVGGLESRIGQSQVTAEHGSDGYHALLGSITARLQRGTTPGNPILVDQWNQAQVQLERVAETIPAMTKLSNDAADKAAFGQYLLNAVQATYGLSGAVDSDHIQLQNLEDQVHQSLVRIDRVMTDLSQDMNRQNVYVNNERQNMTTLSLAIKNGELYGSSLATRAFTQTENLARAASLSSIPQPGERPLVIIRFDRPNVDYQQALYNAVSQALSRKPNATFDLVAISPKQGTAAQLALNDSAARRNAQDVLRTMTDMGIPSSRVQMLASTGVAVQANEVHLFVH